MGPISSPKRSGPGKRFLTSEPNPHFNTLYETVLLDRFQKVFPPTNEPAGYPASGKRKAAPGSPGLLAPVQRSASAAKIAVAVSAIDFRHVREKLVGLNPR